jgi:hypothetical protein
MNVQLKQAQMQPGTHREDAQHTPRAAASRNRLAAALLALAAASAQALTPDLTAYRSMASALDQAVQDRGKGSAASLSDLDRAAAAYVTLKPSLSSPLIGGYLDSALQQARASLSHAPADLEAQVLQARSLMRKALYDQTLSELGGPQVSPSIGAQSSLLASEFGLQGTERSRFSAAQQARDTGTLARLLRLSAARQVQASLTGASSAAPANLNPAQRTATYLALARASGWFTVVQDAPDTGGLSVAQFTQALTQLTSNDAGLPGSIGILKRSAASFVTVSSKALKTGTTLPRQPASGGSVTTIPPVPAPADPAAVPPATVTPTLPAQASALSPAQRQQANLNATYAALARAQTAAGHANLPEARTQLTRAAQTLNEGGLSATPGFDALSSDLDALQTRSGTRALDVQALIAELSNVESRANAQPTSVLDTTSVSVSRLSAALPIWSLLFLIVGVLSLYPLYLLNLAFGGRNTYWRAIAASLLLLSVPVLLEGLGGLLAYLGDLSNVGALRTLGNLSLHQGAWGLPLWLLLAAAAVGLASYGFRGLCRQFGLLGGSGSSSSNPTRIETPQPALDWDEEL